MHLVSPTEQREVGGGGPEVCLVAAGSNSICRVSQNDDTSFSCFCSTYFIVSRNLELPNVNNTLSCFMKDLWVHSNESYIPTVLISAIKQGLKIAKADDD